MKTSMGYWVLADSLSGGRRDDIGSRDTTTLSSANVNATANAAAKVTAQSEESTAAPRVDGADRSVVEADLSVDAGWVIFATRLG